jgi:hypothetical protein
MSASKYPQQLQHWGMALLLPDLGGDGHRCHLFNALVFNLSRESWAV